MHKTFGRSGARFGCSISAVVRIFSGLPCPCLQVGSNRAQILSLGFGQFVVVVLTALVLHTLLMVVLFGLTAPFPKKTIPEPVRRARLLALYGVSGDS